MPCLGKVADNVGRKYVPGRNLGVVAQKFFACFATSAHKNRFRTTRMVLQEPSDIVHDAVDRNPAVMRIDVFREVFFCDVAEGPHARMGKNEPVSQPPLPRVFVTLVLSAHAERLTPTIPK